MKKIINLLQILLIKGCVTHNLEIIIGEVVEQWEFSFIASGKGKWYIHFGK